MKQKTKKFKGKLLKVKYSCEDVILTAVGPSLLDRFARATIRNVQLELALQELVSLKTLKDQHGETEVYRVRQPLAWKQARQLLDSTGEDIFAYPRTVGLTKQRTE